MTAREPIIKRPPAQGRPVDRIVAGLAAIWLFCAVAATLWFFLGFYETDPGFSAASSAALLSLGLGAFAIIPGAVILRLAWTAWRYGFRPVHGLWTLVLALPWIGLSLMARPSEWMPIWLTIFPLLLATPISLWAIVSIILERRARAKP
ncbi:hypothetical protein [Algimonas ampicilliniresistens]|uniref:hypothetical protein n=1 Tax=Algimonas ampicilliniresistens TaxID=1298735 RepID=UPI0024E1632C|nr:hypothetical protein [Algimonas ampicilliniresistens]